MARGCRSSWLRSPGVGVEWIWVSCVQSISRTHSAGRWAGLGLELLWTVGCRFLRGQPIPRSDVPPFSVVRRSRLQVSIASSIVLLVCQVLFRSSDVWNGLLGGGDDSYLVQPGFPVCKPV